jgi:hypothetical protein
MFAIVTGYLQPCESIQQHLDATMTILFIPYLSHCLHLKGPKSTNSKFRSHRPSIQIFDSPSLHRFPQSSAINVPAAVIDG